MDAAVATLFDNKKVRSYMKSQFKLIHDNNIDGGEILNQLIQDTKDRYNFTRISNSEVMIKVEKKKNIDHLEAEMTTMLETITAEKGVKSNFLFKIMKNNNELTIRVKRNNG